LSKTGIKLTIVLIQKFIVIYGENLSEERFFPIPLSKDFYLVFSQIGRFINKKSPAKCRSALSVKKQNESFRERV
jgi:hypothetical protein